MDGQVLLNRTLPLCGAALAGSWDLWAVMSDVLDVVLVKDCVRAVQWASEESLVESVASELVEARHTHVEAALWAGDEGEA